MKTSRLYVVECMENSHRGWENRKRTVCAYTAEDAAFQATLLIDVHGGEKVVSVEPKDDEEDDEETVTFDQISITGVTTLHTTGFDVLVPLAGGVNSSGQTLVTDEETDKGYWR
jgi:hypothetical protein